MQALVPFAAGIGIGGDAAADAVGRRVVGAVDDIVDAAEWLLTAGFVSGETIHVAIDPNAIHLFDAKSGQRLVD